MRYSRLLFFLLLSMHSFAQTGTSGDPFTTLEQARDVTTSGIYYFDVSGTTFSTYVEGGTGWILVASGSAATTESVYATTTALTLQSDMILPAAVYTSTAVTAVRMNATSGPSLPFDVESTDAGVLSNLQNNITLSANTNSTAWTGSGTSYLARSCAGNMNTLSGYIYHACGNTSGMHWQVSQNTNYEKTQISNSDKNDLNLWIRAGSTTLPVTLTGFNAWLTDNNTVQLSWETSFELDNRYFIVERSADGLHWEKLTTIETGTLSSGTRHYTASDETPFSPASYYRLKQVDIQGTFSYSKVIVVTSSTTAGLKIFPNPVTYGIVQVQLPQAATVTILNSNGLMVLKQVLPAGTHTLNLTMLPAGLYGIRCGNNSLQKLIKQ